MSVPLPPGFVLDDDQNNGLPPGFVMDVVDEGGPRSYMSATLDRINPEGTGRRADQRAYMGSDQAKLDRGRASLDTRARLSPGPLGLIYGATRAVEDAEAARGKPFLPEVSRSMVPGFAQPAYDAMTKGGADPFNASRLAKMQRGITGSPLEGATLSFDDELAGLAGAGVGVITGDEDLGRRMKEQRRAEQFASATDTPFTNVVGNIAGGVVSPVNKPMMAVAGIKNVAAAGKSTAQLAREGFRVGGVGGAAYGFGAAEGDFTERLDDAAEGAAWGMVGGALLGGAVGAAGNKASTGKFFPGQTGDAILNMTPEQFSRTGAARLMQTALERSDVPRKDVGGAVSEAFRLFQSSGNAGNRPLTFAQALERTLEQKGYAQAAGNVKSIFQQLQASRAGQGMSQSLDDMAGSQEAYIASALDDTLGPSTLAKERARIRGDQRAIGDAQEDAINQARSMGGNEAGTPAIRQMVERAEMDPNPTVTSWLNRAARDMGFAQTGGAQGQKAIPAFRNAATGDPLGFAKQIVRTINQARKGGAQLDAVTMNLLDEAQTALNAATKSTRGPGGRFGYNKIGSFDEGQNKFRLTYEELEAQTQKFLGLARDPTKRAEFAEMMSNAPEQVKNAVRVKIKEDIAAALKGGNVDDVMPYLGGLRQRGLHDDLAAFLGEDGQKISKVLRDVIDEQTWLKSTDARRLAPADRTSIGKNADVKNIYTANPLTRYANKAPFYQTILGDMATGAIPGIPTNPALTAAKVIGHLTGPKGASVRQLAQTLALRARQQGATTPNAGRLSRMTPAGASAASQGSSQAQPGGSRALPAPSGPAPVRTSQRAPWSPAQVPQGPPPEVIPRVQTGAQRAADKARQRATDAQQRAANAQARKADAETIRKTLLEAKEAEAAAKVAEIQARNAQKVTQAQLKAAVQAAREKVKAAKAAGKQDSKLAARQTAAAAAKRNAEEELDAALDAERRAKSAAKDEAAAMKDRSFADRVRQGTDNRVDSYTNAQRIEVAKANAAADVDPVRTFEETGALAITLGNEPIVIPNIGARDGDDLVRMLSRVEDDLIGPNRDKPEKWSPLTQTLLEQQGNSQYAARKANIPFYKGKDGKWFANVDGQRISLPANIDDKAAVRRTLVYALGRRALETEIRKGLVPGWRTPAERQALETGKKMAKTAVGALALTVGAAGVATGAREVDKRQQSARAKRIMESPELTKIVQRSLKAVRQYDGRADGKFDGDVMTGVSQFQGTYGLGKSSDPGTLDTATLKKLEEMLVFEGKTKLADEIRDIRRGKLKGKEN